VIYALLVLAALSRLLPHPANFTPIGALGLFAGALLPRRTGWLVPIAALLLSDLIIGLYNPLVMAFVYGGFAVGGLLGSQFLRRQRSPLRLLVCSLTGATAFFVLSNFGCWAAGMYPRTAAGLAQCYAMGLPFFRNSLLGDVFYTAALFSLYALAQHTVERTNRNGQVEKAV
jgi:hypothetical protein